MKILDIFYYYYFLFYKNLLKEPEPHIAATLALSFNESLFLNGIVDIIALKCFCYEIKVVTQFSILILIILLNYFFYHKSKRVKNIIKKKPVIFKSRLWSIILTWAFFLITTSWLFWGGIYGKYLLDQCNR